MKPEEHETHGKHETRDKLLDSAGKVFSEKGFRAATVREICRSAGANVAAVNYHFGNKQQLYLAVIEHFFNRAVRKYPPDGGLPPEADPRDKLRAFVRSFLWRMLAEDRPAWHGALMIREISEPTGVLAPFVRQSIQPHFTLLRAIVRELLGPGADEGQVQLAAMSIVGQCTFHRLSRPISSVLLPQMTYTAAEIEAVAEHVTRFSLKALEGPAAELKGRKKGKSAAAAAAESSDRREDGGKKTLTPR